MITTANYIQKIIYKYKDSSKNIKKQAKIKKNKNIKQETTSINF